MPARLLDGARALHVALGLLALITVCLVLWGSAEGPRGTDQYQYVDDVETLAAGGPPVTNLRFVASWLRAADAGEDALAFSHNGPPLHAVAALARFIGAWPAWVVTNLVAHLVAAACVLVVVRGFATPHIAAGAAALYLVSPIGLWQAMNALQETQLAAMVALGLLGWARRDRWWGPALLAAVLLVGVATHPIFVIPTIAWPMWVVARAIFPRRTKGDGALPPLPTAPSATNRAWAVLAMATFLVAAALVRARAPEVFPTTFQPSLAAIVASAVPGESNMYWQLADRLPSIDAELMLAKVRAAVVRHVADIRTAPFYVYLNGALAALIVLLYLSRRAGPERSWLVPIALLHGAYVGMVLLQQPHARLAQIVAPASFVALALVATRLKRAGRARIVGIVTGLALAGSIALGPGYAHAVRHAARTESATLARLTADLADLPANARLALVDVVPHAAVAHALRPRPVLVTRTKLMPRAAVLDAIARFDADVVLGPRVLPGFRATGPAVERGFLGLIVRQVPK